MDAHSDNKRKKKLRPLLVIVPVVLGSAIYFLNQNEKEFKTKVILKEKAVFSKTAVATKQNQPSLDKKNIPNENILQDFQLLYKKDEALIKTCAAKLWGSVEKVDDYGEFKILNYNKTLNTMITHCSFKLNSQEYRWEKLEQLDLPPKVYYKADLNRAVLFYLSTYRKFYKNKDELLKNLNNLISFYKTSVFLTPPTTTGDFFAFVTVLEEFLRACGHETVEGELFVQDIDRENDELSELQVLTKGNAKEMNIYLREYKRVMLIFQKRLQDLFYKYEEDLVDCQ